MELSELTALVKVIQTGSFTRAAEVMGTQKAHVSRTITNLEKKLGVRLIQRSTRSLSLTEVGREIFERAVGILGAIEDTERVAQRILAEPRGVLKLSCGVEFGMIAVNRWVNGFMKDHPQVSVDADYTSRVVDLVHEGFDLAIRLGELPDSRLTARKLGELEYGLFASREYLKRRGIPNSADDLAQHDLLIFSSGSHRGGWMLSENGVSQRVNHTARLIVNNSFAVCDAARSGLGIAQLPLVVANDAVEKNELIPILQKVKLATVPVHAVFPSSRYLTPKVRAFIDYAIINFV